jgi:protocatechuate 3,4-dioxygenase beta subunit
MRDILIITIFSILLSSCSNAQQQAKPKLMGAPCEGCEAVLEFGDRKLLQIDTLPDFQEQGVRIKVEGTIYQADGKTPAKDIVLYVYHTNQEGIYDPKEGAIGWAKKHGYNRAWVKTDKNGHYAFYTIKPAPYPNRSDPAHIHYIILEPNGKYYYLNSCHFEGDSLLTETQINPESPRGGSSGFLKLKKEGDVLIGTRNIVLGKNIPGYD